MQVTCEYYFFWNGKEGTSDQQYKCYFNKAVARATENVVCGMHDEISLR